MTNNWNDRHLELLAQFRPMDDSFMRAILGWCSTQERILLAHWILEAILPGQKIELQEVESQKDVKQVNGGRSIVLDLVAWDADGTFYNVEFEKNLTHQGRLHFYSVAAAFINSLREGEKDWNLRKSYTIFLTEEQALRGFEKGVFERSPVVVWTPYALMKLEEAKGPQIMMLVNSRYEGNDALGQMLHDLWCTDPDEIKYPVLRKIASELKYGKAGEEHMCKLLEDYGEERKEEGIQIGHEKGLTEGIQIGHTEGRAEGRVEGREEGIQIGHTEGRTEEKVSVITRLLKLGYTDWSMIAQIADCSLDLIRETAAL